MTALTIEGIYKDGMVELAETPEGVREARVVVTFLSEGLHRKNMRPMQYGQFADGELSTHEDFQMAEWRGDADLTNDDKAQYRLTKNKPFKINGLRKRIERQSNWLSARNLN